MSSTNIHHNLAKIQHPPEMYGPKDPPEFFGPAEEIRRISGPHLPAWQKIRRILNTHLPAWLEIRRFQPTAAYLLLPWPVGSHHQNPADPTAADLLLPRLVGSHHQNPADL